MKRLLLHEKYPHILLGVFILFWLLLALNPVSRTAWAAENILTILFLVFLIATYRKYQFSPVSYTLIFVFLILHTLGSYYTYSSFPLFELLKEPLSLERNHYDRVIHYLFGVLMFLPAFELVALRIEKFWRYLLAFIILSACVGVFEVIEYIVVFVSHSEIVGTYYLGMQGDQWDAQKDMLLGML